MGGREPEDHEAGARLAAERVARSGGTPSRRRTGGLPAGQELLNLPEEHTYRTEGGVGVHLLCKHARAHQSPCDTVVSPLQWSGENPGISLVGEGRTSGGLPVSGVLGQRLCFVGGETRPVLVPPNGDRTLGN